MKQLLCFLFFVVFWGGLWVRVRVRKRVRVTVMVKG